MSFRSLVCSVAAAGLAATGLAAATPPASGASASLGYDCTAVSGPEVMTAVIDTDAPATMLPGQPASINATSTVTISSARADLVRMANITQVDGTVSASVTVDGVPRSASLAFPRTDVSPTMGTPLSVIATGPAGSIQAGTAGTTIELGAGNFSIHIVGYNASNAVVGQDTWMCTLQLLQPLHVDTVQVGIATTTTVSVQNAPVQYGDRASVTADVAQAGSTAKPAGTVEFTFDGTPVKAEVKGGKAKASLPPSLIMGVRTVTAVFTPSDTNLTTSQAEKTFRVVKADSITSVSAVYRPTKDKIVARGKVVAAYETAVAGKVKYVLKRDGVRIRTKTVELNTFDVARAKFGSITRKGLYTVIARYLGSDTLRRSNDRFRFEI